MKYSPHFLLIPVVALLAAGCASAPSRYYTLDPVAKSDGAPAVNCAVMVGPVSVPEAVDRPQFVVSIAPNRAEIEEFNCWDAPLGDAIARVVSGDLGVLLGTPRVASAPLPGFGPAFRIGIRVERFDTIRGGPGRAGEVLVAAVWTVHPPGSDSAISGATTAREPAKGDSFDSLAAAHSRALAKLSGDIAAAIRSAAR